MSDGDDLERFVDDVYLWLEACHLGGVGGETRFPLIEIRQDLRPLARDAWKEFSSDYPRQKFVRRVTDLSDRTRREYGLYGAQLKYKLSAIDSAAKASKNRFGRLIDLIDSLLKSILGAAGAGEALEELKEALKASLPD